MEHSSSSDIEQPDL